MPVKKLSLLCCFFGLSLSCMSVRGQSGVDAITNTSRSPYARLTGVNMQDVKLTTGFWAERFAVCRDSMIGNMWQLFNNADSMHHGFRNFQIAAGLDSGKHFGPSFMDGDFYKWLEAASSVFSVTRDKKLARLMDTVIEVIGKAQRSDGYLNTEVQIEQRNARKMNHSAVLKEFHDTQSFEAYNLGHLMTCACVYYRATGRKTLLEIAAKAADFLIHYYQTSSPALARSAICPSHYMGIIELYRTTHELKYLALARKLMDLRDGVTDGTDQNQDRIPFRKQTTAVGHAVRANYLYSGAADLFMETGDSTLLKPLLKIWDDVVYKKMYVTGGCGALYDGVSPDGVSYHPQEIQQVHQAYGRDYQLPNFTAHDETCANIGNVLWNWRMLQITGEARYADIIELALYNSVLSGISLNGKEFLYSNPLAANKKLPFQLRWSEKPRDPYIGYSFCCPPNVVRTIAEVGDYMYSLSNEGLWFNLYGANQLHTRLKNGMAVFLTEKTDYPGDGRICIDLKEVPGKEFSLFLRIPGWCHDPHLKINGKNANVKLLRGTYARIKRKWNRGDKVELLLPMPVTLIEANPLVEATRNQVAVKRGPVVYCLESNDLPEGMNIFNVTLTPNIRWIGKTIKIQNIPVLSLQGTATMIQDNHWKGRLYRPVSQKPPFKENISLIPYYSWENRGRSDMEVWIPYNR